MANINFHTFISRQELAEALAKKVAENLSTAITQRGKAYIALSGGSTPQLFLEKLSETDINWEKVSATLVDERFVSPNNPRSNQALIKENLLKNKAHSLHFIPLYYPSETIESAAQLANEKLQSILIDPFDVIVLGMGTDGHTASFFPGGDALTTALNINTVRSVIPMKAKTANEHRLTLSLSALYNARFLILHIENIDKKLTLEKALSGLDEMTMPIRAVLKHALSSIEVYWTS
ncbi:6-phosphogluconolactonase [Liberibacter crescens]|nr:6-phosphogluconolactonase [Liberibacter crescens]AMC13330.1 6-phosphogluconolactonase [Liberibacter crescens]